MNIAQTFLETNSCFPLFSPSQLRILTKNWLIYYLLKHFSINNCRLPSKAHFHLFIHAMRKSLISGHECCVWPLVLGDHVDSGQSLGYMSCSEQSWYNPPSVIFRQKVPWSHRLCRTEVRLSSTLIPELAWTSSQLRLFHRKFFQLSSSKMPLGLPRWLRVKGLQCRRPGFGLWVGKIPWRRKWPPTPVFLPGEFPGQNSLGLQSLGSQRVSHD